MERVALYVMLRAVQRGDRHGLLGTEWSPLPGDTVNMHCASIPEELKRLVNTYRSEKSSERRWHAVLPPDGHPSVDIYLIHPTVRSEEKLKAMGEVQDKLLPSEALNFDRIMEKVAKAETQPQHRH